MHCVSDDHRYFSVVLSNLISVIFGEKRKVEISQPKAGLCFHLTILVYLHSALPVS